jgi:hypothetical protein
MRGRVVYASTVTSATDILACVPSVNAHREARHQY